MKKNILMALVTLLLTSYASAAPQALSREEMAERKGQIIEAMSNAILELECKRNGISDPYGWSTLMEGVNAATSITVNQDDQPLLNLSSSDMVLDIFTSSDHLRIVGIRAQRYRTSSNLATGQDVLVPSSRFECFPKNR